MGGYVEGQDPMLDDAIKMWPKILDFISIPINKSTKKSYQKSIPSETFTLSLCRVLTTP